MFENETDEKLVEKADKYTGGRAADSAPVEMMRRLKESTEKLNKSIEKLDKNAAHYSKVLACLTLILITIGIFQIIFLKLTDASEWLWVSIFIIMAVAIVSETKMFFRK